MVLRVALFANELKAQATRIAQDLSSYLKEIGVEVLLEYSDSSPQLCSIRVKEIISCCDFIVSIGGDGSILHLVHRIGLPIPPIIGVNLGTLGFLADVPVTDLHASFDAINNGQFHISKRLIAEGYVQGEFKGFAINEVAVHRGDRPHLVDLAVHSDGVFVNTFSADGMIVATPGGSTAYSLSAGGPIVSPDLATMILTPICPHTVSNRPIVLLPKESISLELRSATTSVDVAFDGQPPFLLHPGEILEVRPSEHVFPLVSQTTSDFFATLRTKLAWAGSLKNI